MMAEKTTAEIAETGSTEAGTISLAANIVVAYVSNNSLPATELASLLLSVHHAVAGLASGVSTVAEKSEEIEKPTAAQVR
ncbi:MucR family transcriptional regulator, partial [Methylobacterium gnaphalii]|uniref:MucR family transcriptional regulator n=1 Tax=Methylobacterium gnaphalii TaxID=1010610 RepID=UPI001FCF057C